MRKAEELVVLKELLIANKSAIFARAMAASKDNVIEAYGRIEIAVGYIVGVYPKLANKKYTLDFLYDKIDECSPVDDKRYDADTDVSDLISKCIDNNIKKRKTAKKMVLSIVCCAVLLVIAASVVTGLIIKSNQISEDEQGFVILKGTKRIDGQNGVLEIVNYQRFYDTIDKKGEFVNQTDYSLPINTMSSVVTTKENETYMVFQNFETEDGSNTTFDLYRLEKEGWKKLASGDVSNSFLPTYAIFWSTPIYLIADKESNVHAVALLDDMIVIYDYDKENNAFIKNVSPYNFGKINQLKSFSTYYDEKDGEAGKIYVAGVLGGTFTFLKYDIKEKSFEISPKISLGTYLHLHKFAAMDGVIYLLAQTGSNSDSKLCLFTITDAFGTKKSYKITTLFDAKKFTSESDRTYYDAGISVSRTGTNSDGICVDNNGNIHIVATGYVRRDREDIQHNMVMYFKIDSNGNVFSNNIERLYDSEDIKNNVFGGFIPAGDELYYAELYVGDLNTVAIGKITDDGRSELVDIFELTNNVNKNNSFMIKINGQNVLFCSMENSNIYFFQIRAK